MTDHADPGEIKEALKLGWKELEQQSQMRDHLDTKTGTILGFALVSVVEILGFLLLVAAEKDLFKTVGWLGWLFVTSFSVGLLCVLFAMGFSVAQLWSMDSYFPDLDFYWDRLRGRPPEKMNAATIQRMRACSEMNERVSERKSRLASRAAVASGFAVLAFVASVVIIFVRLVRQVPPSGFP